MSKTIPSIPACSAAADDDLFCGGCGHNLRAVPSDRCPECGRRFDRGRLVSSAVPWEHRRGLGMFRAYLWTVVAVTFHPSRVADAHHGALTFRGARSFRRWNVAILSLIAVLAAAEWASAWSLYGPSKPPGAGAFADTLRQGRWPELLDLYRVPLVLWTSVAALCLSILLITGTPGWFFAPRRLSGEQRRRGVALSLYATAPLACGIPLGLAALLLRLRISPYSPWALGLVAIVVGVTLAAYYLIACRILWLFGRSVPRLLAFAALWPLCGGVLVAAVFVGLHALVNYALILYASW